MRTFHGGTHHLLCYLSPCFMAVSPPKTWFFVFLRNSLFSLFFKKRDFCKNTIFRFFWKKTKFDNFRSVSQRVKYHFSKPRPFNHIKRGQKTTLFLIRQGVEMGRKRAIFPSNRPTRARDSIYIGTSFPGGGRNRPMPLGNRPPLMSWFGGS